MHDDREAINNATTLHNPVYGLQEENTANDGAYYYAMPEDNDVVYSIVE